MHSTNPGSTSKAGTRPELVRGDCLCGSIAFELRPSNQYGPGRAMGICHCTRCQRWSGGSGMPFVVVAPEQFKVTRGLELIAHYRDDGSSLRAFCRQCGSSLYQDNGTAYHVGAGALRELKLAPTFHIHVAHKAAWDAIAGEAPQYPEMPAGGSRAPQPGGTR